MEIWELDLLHDGDIERICMCSDEQPLFEMAVDRAFNLFAKINEWPLKQENCHASVSVNDKLHSILVKISTQDDNTVELWEYKWECIYKEPHENKFSDTLLQEVVSRVRDIPKLFYDWGREFLLESEKKWLFAVNVYIKKYALIESKQEIVAQNLAKTS